MSPDNDRDRTAVTTGGLTDDPPRRRTSWLTPLVVVIVILAVYATTVGIYASDLTAAEQRTVHLGDDGAEITLVLKPRGVDPVTQEFTFQLEVDSGSAIVNATGTGVTDPLLVQVRDTAEGNTTQRVTFDEDSLASEVLRSTLTAERRLEAWPFDRYAASLRIDVVREDASGSSEPVAPDLLLDGGLPGWEMGSDGPSLAATSSVLNTDVLISRSFSTVAFALVLTASLVLMAVIALTVSLSVLRGARRMELIFLGWIAGMLFAVPALRNFLPGHPPIGSWVDFLIVLWVVVSLIVSLAMLVLAWYHSPRSRPDRT